MSNTHKEQQAIALRQEGMSIKNIVLKTGLTDYKVKKLTEGIQKVKPINTPLAKSVERVFTLAVRPQGIRDYELHDILHQEYGSTWNTATGKYESNYSSANNAYVKEKVQHRAGQENCNALFVMDWVDVEAPTTSRKFLETAAKDVMSRIDSYVNEYMTRHATRWREDNEEADYARRKQAWAAEHYLLKLAVKGYGGGEPLTRLQDRSLTLTDLLEGTPDAPLASGKGDWYGDAPKYYPEPASNDPFLDHVESQSWLKEVEDRFV
ncbi:hypothetical protein BSF43_18760 [Pseudomonas ogarae]|uniref:hypothetical protein n=1 Tax=Pseudomonas ogarae (strain DSM 112162 / CECT 30235 / F113) TaxID=1114970 RepID=UPI000BB31A80|nr:hypothetical protein [Pseudomonas ogarae]PBJ12921.1 hypothetical protein BSF43_18760 [Pseudomonas ogarae]